ncbi:hypothetical protein [Streptomyces sp. V4I2]|uniref:hypothetical protein n=1 Tax=Streptomyces sp. V4I2 TaxID=3042280 RepID=UPI00277FD1EE|nr:hypothetical protein [Streptomyces sp. V4I2]MDQ1043018.1 hypothetical protein [Streptomyces sp. V4I2]
MSNDRRTGGPDLGGTDITAEPPTQDALNLLASWAATGNDIERSTPANDSEPADSAETPD